MPDVADIDLDELFIEPRPDEEAWEAYLDLALEHLGDERSPGLLNRQIAELEEVIEHRLPFEVGLMLVMGVPTAAGWKQWDDPASEWDEWNAWVRKGICFDVEHDGFWHESWGPRPEALADQLAVASEQFKTVPPLFPLYGHRAMPLTAADGQATSDGNPVLSVMQTDVIVYGADLAAWLHADFGVPLPMWPAEDRVFPFWSDLTG